MGAVTDAATAATAATASEVSRAGADSALSEADVLATSATASKAPDAGGPNAPSAPTVATVASHQAAAAATSAQAVSTLVNASAADKHSRSATGDSSLSGASGDGAAGLAQVSSSAITATDAAPTLALKVTAGVDTPEFAQGLANRVSWMVDNNLNGAKLQVNPPQLGPIEVRIAVLGGHAQVWMTSHSAVTRDALESSTPKLREMLGAQGFGQVSVDISQRSFQERSSQAQTYDWTPSADRAAYSASVSTTASSIPRTSSGVLDAYA